MWKKISAFACALFAFAILWITPNVMLQSLFWTVPSKLREKPILAYSLAIGIQLVFIVIAAIGAVQAYKQSFHVKSFKLYRTKKKNKC